MYRPQNAAIARRFLFNPLFLVVDIPAITRYHVSINKERL
jgi:hypothetical protein